MDEKREGREADDRDPLRAAPSVEGSEGATHRNGRKRHAMAELTPRQQRALTALLEEQNIRDAARRCRIPERTIYRWLSDPTFRAKYRQCSRRLLENAAGTLRAAAGEAVETLRALLKTGNDSVRVRAAVALLGLAVKVDTDELAVRLDALEDTLRVMRDYSAKRGSDSAS